METINADIFGQIFNLIVIWMTRIGMVLLLVLGLIMVKQESTMEKVVNIPLRRGLKLLVWFFVLLAILFTVIVMFT